MKGRGLAAALFLASILAACSLLHTATTAAAPNARTERGVRMKAAWSDRVPMAKDAREYFVAVEGKAGNPGTMTAPWDLTSALEGAHPVPPGSILWIRGGTYRHPDRRSARFFVKLAGTEAEPIHVRSYPGERATIDGGLYVAEPATHLWVWDLDVMLSEYANGDRISPGSALPPGYPDAGAGLEVRSGEGCKYLNLVIHDCMQGIALWVDAVNAEVHGCLLYNNGYQGTDRHHGHCIYTQNREGTKVISNCIMSARKGRTGGSYTMHAYGSKNAYVDNYRIEENIAWEEGPFLIGGGRPSRHIRVLRNYLFGVPMRLGYGAENEDCEIRDNIIARGDLRIEKYQTAVNEGNLVQDVPASKTVLIPNRYDPTRAHLAIYNGAGAATVSVNAGAFLKRGDRFRLMNPRDFYGKPVLQGRYDGRAIVLSMTGEFAPFVVVKRNAAR